MPKIGVVGIPGGWSTMRLLQTVQDKTGHAELIDLWQLVVDLEHGRAIHEGLDVCLLDALIIKKIGSPYSPQMLDRLGALAYVEHLGPRVFSRPASIKCVLDRLSCTVALRMADIPMPPTVVTECVDRAEDAVQEFGRAILKPLYTSKARGMEIVQSGTGLRERIEAFQSAGNAMLYVQKLLRLPGQDLGIAFCGGRFIGCYARVGDGVSWNTTTHSGGRYEPHEPEPQIVELAQRAQSLFDLDFTSVDIALTDDGPVVFEVSAFGGFRGLWEACRINAADHYVDHVLRQLTHGS
jgi:ribosomal protein S6--L-glutamate ligase